MGIFNSVVISAVLFSLIIPAEYEAESKLILDDRKASVSELGRELSELTELGGSVDPIATQAELVVSQRVLELTQAALIASGNTDAVKQFPPELIRKNLEVNILPATNILQLTLTGGDPELTPIVINALSAAVVEENAETIRSQAETVRQFLEGRIPEVQIRLQELEQSERN
ncbi:MAG: chain-length determining protein, partial [Cyanobacteria bacterium P01_C01_bin.147]